MSDSPTKGRQAGAEVTPEMIEAGKAVYRDWADRNLKGDAALAADEPDFVVEKLIRRLYEVQQGF